MQTTTTRTPHTNTSRAVASDFSGTPSTPFPQTWPFWASLILASIGVVLAWLAEPAAFDAMFPLWMVPVGYFIAGIGATALFVSWVIYRAR